MANERPTLDHDAFLLPERQRAAARALSDYGARACCTGESECSAHRRTLGSHGEHPSTRCHSAMGAGGSCCWMRSTAGAIRWKSWRTSFAASNPSLGGNVKNDKSIIC